MRAMAQGVFGMIRIDAIWLALGASDLRAGMDTLLARVVQCMQGGARIHTAYVFANRGGDTSESLGVRRRRPVAVHPEPAKWAVCLAAGRAWGRYGGHQPSPMGLAHGGCAMATPGCNACHHGGLNRRPVQGSNCSVNLTRFISQSS
jgi:hypothetical protein